MAIPHMDSKEFAATLKALDLTPMVAGRIFANPGVTPKSAERQAQRWMEGTSVVPTGVAIALRLFLEFKVDLYPLYLAALDKQAPAHAATTVIQEPLNG